MKTRNMILILVIVAAAFVAFLGFALKRIQTVEVTFNYTDDAVGSYLQAIIEELNDYEDIMLDGSRRLGSFSVLLVDHMNEEAYHWSEDARSSVDYSSLEQSLLRGNHYSFYAGGIPTMMLNCDPLLGESAERAMVRSYTAWHSGLKQLSPDETEYFYRGGEAVDERYYRHMMMESLADAYVNNQPLEVFGAYYRKWAEMMGEDYLKVAAYDYHDGMKMYFEYKTLLSFGEKGSDSDEEGFIKQMVEGLKQPEGVYAKEDEYRLMGFLWFVWAERLGIDLFEQDDMRVDMYKRLLDGVPVAGTDTESDYEDYEVRYLTYEERIDQMLAKAQNDAGTYDTIEITSEAYRHTYKLGGDQYVYTEYSARFDDGTVIERPYVLVKVAPYSIEYDLGE